MKFGPFTFQCACFVCKERSIASARLRPSSAIDFVRTASDSEFLVLYMGVTPLAGVEGNSGRRSVRLEIEFGKTDRTSFCSLILAYACSRLLMLAHARIRAGRT